MGAHVRSSHRPRYDDYVTTSKELLMRCQLDLQSILGSFKNSKKTSPPGVELKNASFREFFVSHIPSMTSGNFDKPGAQQLRLSFRFCD